MTMTSEPTTTTPVSPAALREMLRADPEIRILDVRTGGEFETVHIPGSYNVPLDRLSEHARELASLDKPVVVVCQSGARATQACTRLSEAGKADLQLLEGGIASWEQAGGDVVRGGNRWAMDRQVRLVAGSLVLAGIVTSLKAPKAKFLSGAVGAGLTFSAVTNTCAMAQVLSKLPYNRTPECKVDEVVRQMQG